MRRAVDKDVSELREAAQAFAGTLRRLKAGDGTFSRWYPYNTIDNFVHLDGLLTGPRREILRLAEGRPIADIGAADGDLAFFLESLGVEAHVVDHEPTNFNWLLGARRMKELLKSSVEIHDVDL